MLMAFWKGQKKNRGSLVKLKVHDRNLESRVCAGFLWFHLSHRETAIGHRNGKHKCHILHAIHQQWRQGHAKMEGMHDCVGF